MKIRKLERGYEVTADGCVFRVERDVRSRHWFVRTDALGRLGMPFTLRRKAIRSGLIHVLGIERAMEVLRAEERDRSSR